jgi:competence protein ComEC
VEQLLLGMALGICSALLWPELPSSGWGWGALLPGFILLFRSRFAGAVLIGLGWALLFFNHQLFWLKEQQILTPAQHELNVTVLQAYQKSDRQQILVSVQSINQQTYWPTPTLRLTLSNNKNRLKRGDQLHILAKLKIPHGLGNPAGFNAERWLLGQGITATGTVSRAAFIYQAINNSGCRNPRIS